MGGALSPQTVAKGTGCVPDESQFIRDEISNFAVSGSRSYRGVTTTPPIEFIVHASKRGDSDLTSCVACCIMCVTTQERVVSMARIQVSMDDAVLQRIDEFAKKSALSRSAFLSMAAVDYIDAKEKAPLISGAFASMAQLLDARVKGEISQDEFQLRLDGMDRDLKELGK